MIIDLVDDETYATTNCYVHQLTSSMKKLPGVKTVPLSMIHYEPKPQYVISRLKQRTLNRAAEEIKFWCEDAHIVVYDQDPWYALADDSPGKGTYERLMSILNVKNFLITTQSWVDLMQNIRLPVQFVGMGLLPEYCVIDKSWESRSIDLGFTGTVHPRRKKLFDQLSNMGINVQVNAGNSLAYHAYLRELSNTKIFIHSEDSEVVACGRHMNYADGLWVKDVEALGRGCFTIRNRGKGFEDYYNNSPCAFLYDSPDEIPSILDGIRKMDDHVRQETIDAGVKKMKTTDVWLQTAQKLVTSF